MSTEDKAATTSLSADKLMLLSKQQEDGRDTVIPSSDVETDKMEEMEQKESDLERLAKADGESAGSREGSSGSSGSRGSRRSRKRSTPPSTEDHKAVKKVKGGAAKTTAKEEVAKTGTATATPSSKSSSKSSDQPDLNESDEEMDEADEDDEDEVDEDNKKKAVSKDKEDEETENRHEQERVSAMAELKEIEIEFAQLKDRLYETQLKKLEFELKLCELNKHPDFLFYMKLIDEDFKGRIERSFNLQKHRLQCLDNQTHAYRVQIHQQFIKNCADLKYKEIRQITADWYEINRERRAMDTASLGAPEHFQYNRHITAANVDDPNTINDLVLQRNAVYNEISQIQGLVRYKRVFPTSLNYMQSCTSDETAQDLAEMGIH